MKATLILAAILASSVLATPDCYDFTVTQLRKDYTEILPLMVYYNHIDYLTIDPGANCAFYTYGNTFFKSYNTSIVGIHFNFMKGSNLQCTLDNTLRTFSSETWLYANSMLAD